MEDNKDNNTEGEILNGEKTYTYEEVEAIKKKMQSDSEKGVQKLIQEQKSYKQSLIEIGKVADDKEYLVELYDNNPEVAKIILNQYYNGQSINDFKESIGFTEDYSDPKIIDKLVSQKAKTLEEGRLIDKTKNEFISKLKMTAEETEKFEEAFEERKQLKSFNVDNLERILEKSFREISDDTEQLKVLKEQSIIANTIGTSEGKNGTGGGEKQKSTLSNEISSFLAKNF